MTQPMHAVAGLLLLALVPGCAANDFAAPIQAFGQAIGEGSRLVDAYGQERTEANFALRRAAIAQRADQVVVRGADCRVGAAPESCVLRMGPGRMPVDRTAPAARPAELAAALDRYADSLSAVAVASTEADFEAATRRLSTALTALGGVVPRAQGAAALAEPAGGLLANLGGIALQQRRFSVLRGAINAADPAVQEAAGELAAVVAGQRDATADDRAALIARLASLYNGVEPRPGVEGAAAAATRETLLTRIGELTAAQRRLLAGDPAAELRRLGEAHAALRQAVNDPTPPIAQITEDLKRLSDRLRRAADSALRLALG